MKITFDPAKREKTLAERGLDFADAIHVFEGRALTQKDDRFDYGEVRFQTYGHFYDRLVIIIWTPRGESRHIISMRKCNGAKKQKSRTDWAKVDAHVITAEEYEEIPEWTEDQFDRAEISIDGIVVRPANGTLTKPGRPKLAAPKKSVHLRLSPDVLAHFRKTGPGWQTRIDEALRKAAKLGARKA